MTISLQYQAETLTWGQFIARTPRFSIALDGYVSGGPRFDPLTPRASFNHHDQVNRLATRATCGQVLMALRQGLFSCFRNEQGPQAVVYVNDCDEDVCTSWALLKHHYLAEGAVNPLLNRLVAMEDALDSTAGAYPFPKDMPALRELAWVFEPYRQFRASGRLQFQVPQEFRSVISDVEHRILQHIAGRGHEVPLDTRYDVLGGGPRWSLVREVGAQARTGMFSDGIKVFVTARELASGKMAYIIGKMDHFNPLDLVRLTKTLNETEHCLANDQWGGGDMIIGSPRNAGSGIAIEQLTQLMNQAMARCLT